MLIETNLPNLLHRGKVRDTYVIDEQTLLMVATDRISAFDVVLPSGIPNKGLVLNRISAFWFEKTAHIIPNHFIQLADEVPALLSSAVLLNDFFPEVTKRGMVVKRADRIDIECIVRGYITGSAWSEYRRQGTVWGDRMEPGMLEGEKFPYPLFTPTTKAEEGHDQNMTWKQVVDMVGEEMAWKLRDNSIDLYQFADKYTRERGIILADTKFEFGLLDGQLILIDELLTPDSSRFWDMEGYEPGKSQSNFDKQFVRDYLDSIGWNHEPPAPVLPDDVIAKTSKRYLEAYRRLTGERL
ncbi:MAG TPA: phosphoribosylaminoimidazolesuccinocarboxamide synthase [Candidatus Paceibacterota bacterium]